MTSASKLKTSEILATTVVIRPAKKQRRRIGTSRDVAVAAEGEAGVHDADRMLTESGGHDVTTRATNFLNLAAQTTNLLTQNLARRSRPVTRPLAKMASHARSDAGEDAVVDADAQSGLTRTPAAMPPATMVKKNREMSPLPLATSRQAQKRPSLRVVDDVVTPTARSRATTDGDDAVVDAAVTRNRAREVAVGPPSGRSAARSLRTTRVLNTSASTTVTIAMHQRLLAAAMRAPTRLSLRAVSTQFVKCQAGLRRLGL
jgi:hypothetical protein